MLTYVIEKLFMNKGRNDLGEYVVLTCSKRLNEN